MTVDALRALVSGAIWRAEQLDELGLETACLAWMEVSQFEEELAKVIPAKDAEGRIARRGAVRAALKAKKHVRAQNLVKRYVAERGAPRSLRADFREMMDSDSKALAEQFPFAARHHKPSDFHSLVSQLLERGPFCLAAA